MPLAVTVWFLSGAEDEELRLSLRVCLGHAVEEKERVKSARSLEVEQTFTRLQFRSKFRREPTEETRRTRTGKQKKLRAPGARPVRLSSSGEGGGEGCPRGLRPADRGGEDVDERGSQTS